MKRFLIVGAILAVVATGCGGGGGTGGGPLPSSAPTAAPPPPPPPGPTSSITGTAVDYSSAAPLGGFTVTVGAIPSAATCNSAQTQSLNVCGAPATPVQTVKTASNGSFSITGLGNATYMVTIGKDRTYATLHCSVTISGATALGTVKIAALSSDEQAWVADINNERTTVSSPTSFGNLAVDEYAEEQARAWAAGVANGSDVYGDPGMKPFQAAYAASPGALYGAGWNIDLVGSAGAYLQADANWMAEKANCPNGNWQTCPYSTSAPLTDHYVNLSNTDTVWAGVGESASSFNDPPYGQEWAYDIIFVDNVASPGPASKRRFLATAPRPHLYATDPTIRWYSAFDSGSNGVSNGEQKWEK